MSDNSTNLQLPFVMPNQAQKHVTVNEGLLVLDAVVQATAISDSLSTQPASPADGSVYILPPGKTGADWDIMGNYTLAYYRDGAWVQINPREGWRIYVQDSDLTLIYNGTQWVHHADDRVAKAGDTMTGNLGIGGAPDNARLHTQGGEVKFDQSGEVFFYIRRADAGLANNYVGNQQFCALNSNSTYTTYFKSVCQQLNATAGAEASMVTLEATTAGALGAIFQYNGTSDHLALFTTGAERVRVDASGNLMVGTTVAGAKFHVNGSARIDDSIELLRTAGDPYIDFKDNAGDDFDCRLQQLSDGFSIFTGGNGATAERVHVRSTGSVRFIPLASAPSGVAAGDVYFDSTLGKLRCYDGSTWQNLH